ncbi:MAG TPA: GNAT family N-acetyltransferase [Thermoanaerobaculia bacterium]|nr:GNAT family N-acetyltransferase [Thermoanaerobaculia bacterium]
MEWRRDDYSISTDRDRLDREVIHAFLRESYWARGIPREVVDRAIENALCFGLYAGDRQIGFARVISDLSTFAYLADVFVLDAHRGRGLGTWLVEVIRAHPDLQNLRRWMLATEDAHGLYRKFGFRPLQTPQRIMEIAVPDIYGGPGPTEQKGRS